MISKGGVTLCTMRRMARPFFLLLASFIASAQPDVFENKVFTVRQIALGNQAPGVNLFSAVVTNRTSNTRTFALDIRAEALGVGTTNWQKQFSFTLKPQESRTVETEYEIWGPLLRRIIVRFGEGPEYSWRKEVKPAATDLSDETAFSKTILPYSLYLNELAADRLESIRSGLPGLIERSRNEDPLRTRLRGLFHIAPAPSGNYDYRQEPWPENSEVWDKLFVERGVNVEPFSIAAPGGMRISAFSAALRTGSHAQRPIIFLLSGNPPGTKESQAGAALFFAKLGYRSVAVDRRLTSRILDEKAKFLTNFSDPVNDLLRLIDYFSDKYPRSKIGLFAYSAGAIEGKFAAAFDRRISAAVLACGIASHDSFFKDDAWVPTYSGLIIFPELGLGHPNIGKLTDQEFFAELAKLKPEHNVLSREIFREAFPYFEDLDPVRVTPLIAPVPLLVITGAQDQQFKPEGVVEVDEAVQAAYAKYGLKVCSELYIEPREPHVVDPTAAKIIPAFFERWLK